MPDEYPPEFLALLQSVTAKRPRIVIEHILTHGYITTEELEQLYGYKHPPRAARDVREQGIPLETFKVKNSAGRTIAAYRFGEVSSISQDKLGGRKVFSKAFKGRLLQKQRGKCAVCLTVHEERYLQVDHRIPYEVAGETERQIDEYMLLCGSCNRAKSWSCEHCPNWLETKSPAICDTCYWASPASYHHIALRQLRRVELVWADQEVSQFDKLASDAEAINENINDYIKRLLGASTDDPESTPD